ncbi:MAG TPA: hydantoinase/oxoprolinase family protein, partial [Planctomycetota bacterium]|nr:hydantoinase/oxoprolinase family protein [Planctomycetota bacterium]
MAADSPTRGWQLGVDRGGTFTDVVARAPDGALHVRKWLTLSPAYGNATVAALAEHARAGHALDELRIGTTVATNALLERAGAKVLLLTTRGFADLLAIGHQDRPDLFALAIAPRTRLHAEVREIDERLLADGSVERAPDRAQVAAALAGWQHVAVLSLHATVNPAHELLVEQVARAAGIEHVTLSHRVSPEPGAVARGDSTVADAYLTPLLRRHLSEVAAATGGARVRFMQSSGGLVDAARAEGKDSLLSGPAGGAVAVGAIARQLGLRAAIGLDMGGTSTDVCRCAGGEVARVFSTRVEGLDLRAPAADIVTVAAGGGSRLFFRDGRYAVGPQSAGADPGPACYGRGGPATLTDANLVLGRLAPEHFPHLSLDVAAARAALAAVAPDRQPEEAAAGFVAIANENMAAAIRTVSVARGHDVRDHALIAFGGAAGQHCCALARRLGMREIVVHPHAGVLSAWGLLLADVRHHEVAAVTDPATRVPDFPEAAAREALAAQGHPDALLVRSVDVRYAGADHALNLPWSERWEQDFLERHRALYGFQQHGVRVELVAARVDAIAAAPCPPDPPRPEREHVPQPLAPASVALAPAAAAGGSGAACIGTGAAWPLHRRADLAPGARIDGPAVVVEDLATTVIDPGWRCRVDGHGLLRLTPSDEDAALPAG